MDFTLNKAKDICGRGKEWNFVFNGMEIGEPADFPTEWRGLALEAALSAPQGASLL